MTESQILEDNILFYMQAIQLYRDLLAIKDTSVGRELLQKNIDTLQGILDYRDSLRAKP